jgi:BirA family biotin operon repressor/biotin-[acetyl-CoA-carboxylase] ligase
LDRTELIVALLMRVDHWLTRLGTNDLFESWKSRLETLGQTVTVVSDAGTVHGLAEAVDEQGALILNDGGERRRVIAGDVLLPRALSN